MLQELLHLNEANWDEKQIEQFLRKMKVKNFTINPDKTVDVEGDVNLFNRKLDNLPIKFGKVTGSFLVRHNKLKNLRNFPKEIGGDLSISHNLGIKLQEGNGIVLHGKLLAADIELKTLEGIGQSFSEINGSNNLSLNHVETGGIGLILIKGLKPEDINTYGKIGKALVIIKKYLGQGKKGLLLCQEELIEAGFDEYAKL